MMKNGVNAVFTVIGGACGWFFGGLDGLVYALVAFMICDYVTGVLSAAAAGELSSKIGFGGILKKGVMFLIVGCAHVMDVYILGGGSTLRTAALFFYICNEGISLLENAGALGLPLPKQLKGALAAKLRQVTSEQ